jgi:hypothetical protein
MPRLRRWLRILDALLKCPEEIGWRYLEKGDKN